MTTLRSALFGAFVLGLGTSITLAQGSLIALALLYAWRLAREPDVRGDARWPLLVPLALFSAATFVSAAASPHPLTALVDAREALLAGVLYVTLDALRDEDAAERFLTALAAVTAMTALLGLVQVAVCPGPGEPARWPRLLFHRCSRARGFFSIYMTLAGILTMVLLATLPRLLPGGRHARWFPLAWLTGLAGLVATYVRGAWLGFAVGVLALVALLRRGRLWLVAGLAVLALAFVLGPAGVRARFLSMADAADATIAERLYMYRSGLAILKDHPWLGTGKGELRHVYERYAIPGSMRSHTSHVHNTPLQIATERGLFALAAWLWIWVAFYRDAVRVLRRLPPDRPRARTLVVGSLGAITGFLATGLSEYSFGDSEVVMVAWALMALPYVVERSGRAAGAPVARPALSRPGTGRSTCGA